MDGFMPRKMEIGRIVRIHQEHRRYPAIDSGCAKGQVVSAAGSLTMEDLLVQDPKINVSLHYRAELRGAIVDLQEPSKLVNYRRLAPKL